MMGDDDTPDLPEWFRVMSGGRYGTAPEWLEKLGARVSIATSPRHGRRVLLAHAARLAIRRGETVAWVRVRGDGGEGLETVTLRTEDDLDRVVLGGGDDGRRDED